MRAQVLESFNEPYVFKDIPKPDKPQGKDILVEVQAASYCHTDAVFASGQMWKDLPRVGSHEFAGKIVALGPEVDASSLGLSKGQLVGVPGRAYHPCGHCYECANNDGDPAGYGVWCVNGAGNLGLSRDGGFEEFALADSRQVAPTELSAVETAPLMCAGLTIWNGLEAGGVRLDGTDNSDKTVAIIGAGGGLGHLGVQFAVSLGCKVIAVDTGDKALQLLSEIKKDLGAEGQKVAVVDGRKQKAEDVRIEVCGQPEPSREGEKGADAALILPESQQAFEFGMKLLRSHGTCVTVSFPIDGFHMQPRDLVFRHIRLVGVLVGRNRQLRAMLKFAAKHGIRAKTTTYSLEQLNDLVHQYHQGASGKLVVDMQKS